ncbi:CPBP family intramembrane metalloprotease [Leptotrichia sp. OH3620_COT-345]|uniref:CPBP family intramembrane glutamic endopeptidase n=1 Tax=Leptotrichia sp. OH3620_COT-345 TaxID=2491048 RepID=UPI000F6461A3|nr:CPBP family intramembrane glutamic endopeptidase [Leptotrichia sp. OH3620_COT-345]RRD38094.1 CPBP family intramembrane metalloprotease [Leptotrichia sp. OH3620_COT-345]
MEEMIFREIIFNFLKRKTKYANIIQATLSAFFHFYFVKDIFKLIYRIEENLYSDWLIIFIPSFFMGLTYGYLKEKTGKIDVAIFFHILYSFSFYYLSSFYIKISSGFMEKISKMRLTGYNTVIYSFTFIFVIWFIVLIMIIFKRNRIFDKPEGKNG